MLWNTRSSSKSSNEQKVMANGFVALCFWLRWKQATKEDGSMDDQVLAYYDSSLVQCGIDRVFSLPLAVSLLIQNRWMRPTTCDEVRLFLFKVPMYFKFVYDMADDGNAR